MSRLGWLALIVGMIGLAGFVLTSLTLIGGVP